MSHHLARELIPLDAGSITQNGREPGEKEMDVFGSFGGIAEGIPILARVLQFFLNGFCWRDEKFHGGVILLSRISFAVVAF